jgi:hypothetical protein
MGHARASVRFGLEIFARQLEELYVQVAGRLPS